MLRIIFLALSLIFSTNIYAEVKQLSSANKQLLNDYLNKAVTERYFPGAQLIIGTSKGVVFSNCYGYLDYSKKNKVDSTTIYDLASCTKIFSTTLSVMTLIDEGKITLNTKISDRVLGAKGQSFKDVTVRDLLYHASGFKPTIPIAYSLVESANEKIPLLSRYKSVNNPYLFDTRTYVAKDIKYSSDYVSKEYVRGSIKVAPNLYILPNYFQKVDSMINESYNPARLGVYAYSDLNFYFLQKIVENSTFQTLDKYAKSLYDKMGVKNIGYKPLEWYSKDKIAPTEFDALFRRDTLQGMVHDEFASVMGGVGGHAGLFGSASSVAQICEMFLKKGIYGDGMQMVRPETIERFALPRRFSSGAIRGLGFHKLDPAKTPYSYESYGHTGYTGTYFWIDPKNDFYVVFLTNRVHPTRANKKLGATYREKLWEMIEEMSHNF
ncbi:MAG: serine hydrolase [Rikenellaceae bacterium]